MTHFVLALAAAILLANSLHAVPAPDQNQKSPDAKEVTATEPMRKPSLPGNVTYIAVDTDSREIVAYLHDGSMLGRYPLEEGPDSVLNERVSPRCGDLPIEEAKTLPGWNAIEKYADDNWGDGSRNVVTNPEKYPDSGAQFCVTEQVVELTFDKDPICHDTKSSPNGTITNTTGEVTAEIDQGWTTGSTQTVTKSATIGVAKTFSFSVGVPEVASTTQSVTVSTEFTNSKSTAFEVQYQDTTKTMVKIATQDGKQCQVSLSTTSCDMQATGKIQIYATGWIWFNYNDKTKGHYKWAVSIDAVLSENDRSSWTEFKGSMSSEAKSVFQGGCDS
ncbi:hypothetical protein BDZ89DRAFT_1136474 [Hymenopellis radicata]|nr:hypothetical protein BDZ89DRAFT_1143610 [Hymenopellis radicata]KAF9023837.1 hypothetical protein BDZ89DRAFT_1136474 [Hymenopellis radicata]